MEIQQQDLVFFQLRIRKKDRTEADEIQKGLPAKRKDQHIKQR